jgi:hypothetical protein
MLAHTISLALRPIDNQTSSIDIFSHLAPVIRITHILHQCTDSITAIIQGGIDRLPHAQSTCRGAPRGIRVNLSPKVALK